MAGGNTMCEECNEKLEKFEQIEIVDHWLYEIEKKAKRTLDAAANADLAPLDENDIKAILLSHATGLLGTPVDARRGKDLDNLIRANGLR
jgi:hypothetical protein